MSLPYGQSFTCDNTAFIASFLMRCQAIVDLRHQPGGFSSREPHARNA